MRGLWCIVALSMATGTTAYAEPLQHRDYDPVKQLFGLPAAAPRFTTESHWQLELTHASVFMGGQRSDEFLYLDGETSKLAIRYHRRLDDCWSVGLSTAVLAHAEGHFDRAIDDWHQFFGLPDGDRDESPYFRLLYDYRAAGESGYRIETATGGIGDTQLSVLRQHQCRPGAGIWRAGVKLPSGDPERFTGSGAADVFVDYQASHSRRQSRWQWHYSLGALHTGDADGLPRQHAVVLFGLLSGEYRWRSDTDLLLQFDAHSALFDSDIRELGMPGLQLTAAVRRHFFSGALEFSISEDAAIDTAPDIVARLAWRTTR